MIRFCTGAPRSSWKNPGIGVALSLAALLAVVATAVAQTPPLRLPGAAEPGRRERPTPPLPDAPSELQWIIDLPAGVEPPEALAEETMTLDDIALTGVTAYRRADLLDLFDRYLGTEITLGEFYAIARAIQARYQADGYLLSFTYVPPQTVEDGVFTIAVVEGYIDKLIVEDANQALKRTLERVLAPTTRSQPLRSDVLERSLLLANDLPGIRVTGVLQPSEGVRGAAELVVKVAHDATDGTLVVDNRGSEFTGPWRANGRFSLNSFLGRGEQLSVDALVTADTRELKAFGLDYSQPVGADGLRVAAGVGYNVSEPGFTLDQFDVETTSLSANLDATYPLIRSRDRTLTLGAGLAFLNTEVDLLGGDFSRDRIRTLNAVLNYSQSGLLGGNSGLTLRFTQGLPVLAATDPDKDTTSRADAEPTFNRLNLDVVHAQPLPGRFSLLVSASGQYAASPLPAAEEFALGGERFGRAYNPAEITGERGIALSLEMGYDYNPKYELLERVRPYVFYDFGKSWDESSSSSAGLAQSLASAGLGVRMNLAYGATLDFEYAHPLTRTPSNQSGDKDGRFFVFIGFHF